MVVAEEKFVDCLTLKAKGIRSYEMSVIIRQSKQRNIPENLCLEHCCENFKSGILGSLLISVFLS